MNLANEYAALRRWASSHSGSRSHDQRKHGQEEPIKPNPQPQPDRATPEPGATPKRRGARSFAQLDADGDGAFERRAVEPARLWAGGRRDCRALHTADLNNDGQIDLEEWIASYDRYQACAGNSVALATMSRSLELDILGAGGGASKAGARRSGSNAARLAQGKSMHRPGRPVPVETKEGKGAVNDALAFAKQPPLPGFLTEQVAGLALAAEDHVADIGPRDWSNTR